MLLKVDGGKEIKSLLAGIKRLPERLYFRGGETLRAQGEILKEKARLHLAPIYAERGPASPKLTGKLRNNLTVEFLSAELAVLVYSDVPYARRRHFENRAHPQTVGYLCIPLFEQASTFFSCCRLLLLGVLEI